MKFIFIKKNLPEILLILGFIFISLAGFLINKILGFYTLGICFCILGMLIAKSKAKEVK